MQGNTPWRALALFGCLGWAFTAAAWGLSVTGSSSSEPVSAVSLKQAPARNIQPAARRTSQRHQDPGPDCDCDQPANIATLRDEVRAELEQEVQAERAERREARGRQHEQRLLSRLDSFVEEEDLSEAAANALEESLLQMHDRLEALRGSGPPGPPGEEGLAALAEAFEQMESHAAAVLDDDALERFSEQMKPRPLRDRDAGLFR